MFYAHSFVIAGLDPAIAAKRVRRVSMDHWVKLGGDDWRFPQRFTGEH